LIADVLEHVAAELAFGDRLDEVERELGAQLVFKRHLQRLSLSVLGTLFRLALEAVDLGSACSGSLSCTVKCKDALLCSGRRV